MADGANHRAVHRAFHHARQRARSAARAAVTGGARPPVPSGGHGRLFRQAGTAASAALKVALGRITARVFARSGR